MTPCLAIIDSNTLENIALKDILWEIFNQVEILQYNDIESFILDSNRHFVHFFVSSDILFENADEFETLKEMTTVLSQGCNANLDRSGYRYIDTSCPEEEIISRIIHFNSEGRYGKVDLKNDGLTEKEILSDREKEVLALIVKGLINKEIAQKLNISITTVIFHRNNICEKLQTRSIGKLTVYAVLSGIISLQEIN